ncbi:MAG: glycosyltransferase family 2 protein, partial [Chloroflexi bacterium]|nr:glycosyltransferase family 2 protein [Chloroflexota bacterium]
PCYNEESGIALTLGDMPAIVDEVIVVDNNSRDRTAEVARSLGAVVIHEPVQGYGAAYKRGFRTAKGDIIVTMDGDGTYPRNFIPVLLDVLIDEDLDFITCDRTGHKSRGSGTALRVFGNWVLGVVQALLFGHYISDSQSGMWVFRRSILSLIELTSDGMALSEEIKIEAFSHPDIEARELPIYYRARVGESKLNVWKDGFRNLLFLFRKRWMMLGFVRQRRGFQPVIGRQALQSPSVGQVPGARGQGKG